MRARNHVETYTTGEGGTFVVLTPQAGAVPVEEWRAYHREREDMLQRVASSLSVTITLTRSSPPPTPYR
jgi:hypothetical protein